MPDDQTNREDHQELTNVGARAGVIRNGFNEMYQIDAHIAEMQEKHVKPHQKERTALWRTMKADTNIARKDLELDYKRYKRLRDAAGAENDDDLDKLVDDIREIHEALHPGQMVDWIRAINGEYDAAA
jgi:hypothetical protein